MLERKKPGTKLLYPNQGLARNARIAKRVSKSQEIGGKGYPNHYKHDK